MKYFSNTFNMNVKNRKNEKEIPVKKFKNQFHFK